MNFACITNPFDEGLDWVVISSREVNCKYLDSPTDIHWKLEPSDTTDTVQEDSSKIPSRPNALMMKLCLVTIGTLLFVAILHALSSFPTKMAVGTVQNTNMKKVALTLFFVMYTPSFICAAAEDSFSEQVSAVTGFKALDVF